MLVRLASLSGALVLCALLVSVSPAQEAPGTVRIKEDKAGLLMKAVVAPADAQKTAQARFPAGKIKSGEIEREDGKLIYSFAIQLPGVRGIEEVNVDALTGAIIRTEHENPAAEAKEKAAEKATARPKSKKPA